MFNRKLKREISNLILEGKSRQEVFELLKPRLLEFDVAEDKLIRFIRYRPTLKARMKYNIHHKLLMGLILLLAFASVLFGYSMYLENKLPFFFILIFPLFEIIVLIQMIYYVGQAYNAIAIVLVYQSIKNMGRLDFSPEMAPYTIAGLAVTGIIVSLAIFLSLKMCSPRKQVTIDLDFNGQMRKVVETRFVDPEPDSEEDIL